jgi:hypothetical protein
MKQQNTLCLTIRKSNSTKEVTSLCHATACYPVAGYFENVVSMSLSKAI